MNDESIPLAEVEAERVVFERRIAVLERRHKQVRAVVQPILAVVCGRTTHWY